MTRLVTLDNRGQSKLGEPVAQGGEGAIWRVGDAAVKIYHDQSRIAREALDQKLTWLGRVRHPGAATPRGLVRENSKVVGWWGPWVEGEPLARFFVTDWRQRRGHDPRQDERLTSIMRSVVVAAHDEGITLVDANEMNWIVAGTRDLPEPVLVDTDSWAIPPKWPARFIMPSIRDWTRTGFNRETDWFAFACVTFQIWTGLHPYQGRLAGYKPSEMERRIVDRRSVLDKDVVKPKSMRPISTIPKGLLDWYGSVLRDGERNPPPEKFGEAAPPKAARTLKVTSNTGGAVRHELIGRFGSKILRVWYSDHVLLDDGTLRSIDRGPTEIIARSLSRDAEMAPSPEGVVVAWRDAGGWLLGRTKQGGDQQQVCVDRPARIVSTESGLFEVSNNGITQIFLTNARGRAGLHIARGRTWTATSGSLSWYDGGGVVSMLGARILYTPGEDGTLMATRASFLKDKRVGAASLSDKVGLVVYQDKRGQWTLTTFSVKGNQALESEWEDVASPNIPGTTTETGLLAYIPEDGVLKIVNPTSHAVREVRDGSLRTSYTMTRRGSRVMWYEGDELWHVSVA